MVGENIITIKIIPRSSKNEVIRISEKIYKIKITAPPVDGAVNEVLIRLLSDHFSVPKSCIEIIRGLKGRTKIVKIIS